MKYVLSDVLVDNFTATLDEPAGCITFPMFRDGTRPAVGSPVKHNA